MKITLLDLQDCIGNQRKEPFKYGYLSYVTDFASLTGIKREYIYGKNNKFIADYWTKTPSQSETCSASCIGVRETPATNPNEYGIGVRPVIVLENEIDINDTYIGNQKLSFTPIDDTIQKTYYGWFPQKIVPYSLQNQLQDECTKKKLKETGKVYRYGRKTFKEYEYQGKKYIQGSYMGNSKKGSITFSDGRTTYSKNSYIWIEVKPISWILLDEHRLVSEDILFAMELDKQKDYDGNFENTELSSYLNGTFLNNIMPDILSEKIEINIASVSGERKIYKKVNPYNFNFNNVSEEDIIKGALLSDIPVFLHGASGDGKSARVKQFDEDATIIYLRNSSLESFNGKSVYNSETGEMIDIMPSWLKKVYEKCEKEPNKLHIVFFDEINNASNVIQGMAFNVVLNKEVNGIWKLPENARIVAAGNEMKDSLSAEELSEPLFNRFAHVYINTTTEDWLKWATTPSEKYERLDNSKVINEYKVHPSIYAYIAYKSLRKKSVLRTKYNGVTPNADPRKWEMASKVLYATNRPDMLRSLIGKELTKDFIEFTKKEVISVEDVVNHNYDETIADELNIAEKYNLAVGLSRVTNENLETVRNFVYNLGKEIGATFDTLWTYGNDERLEELLKIKNKTKNTSESVKLYDESLDFTFLDLDSDKIKNTDLFNKRGYEAEITDFAICLGGEYNYSTLIFNQQNGYYWTLNNADFSINPSPKNGQFIIGYDSEGQKTTVIINKTNFGARPILINASDYREIENAIKNQDYQTFIDNLPIIKFGEYPQEVFPDKLQKELNELYNDGQLELTGNYYTIYDNENYNKFIPDIKDLKEQRLYEYIYKGLKFVKVKANFFDEMTSLSNESYYDIGEDIWILVKPIEWYLYKNNEGQYCLLSLKVLFAGMPFDIKKTYNGDFENTFIKRFMDEHFSKDIVRNFSSPKGLEENIKTLKK